MTNFNGVYEIKQIQKNKKGEYFATTLCGNRLALTDNVNLFVKNIKENINTIYASGTVEKKISNKTVETKAIVKADELPEKYGALKRNVVVKTFANYEKTEYIFVVKDFYFIEPVKQKRQSYSEKNNIGSKTKVDEPKTGESKDEPKVEEVKAEKTVEGKIEKIQTEEVKNNANNVYKDILDKIKKTNETSSFEDCKNVKELV